MKAINTLLAASALATIAGAAQATIWNIEMDAVINLPQSPLNGSLMGFSGQWDDVSGIGSWTGTTTIPGFNITMHYPQTFTMDETTGAGMLSPLEIATCTSNSSNACVGYQLTFIGALFNTNGNPADENSYKNKIPFTPADGWSGEWTLQVINITVDDADYYIPMPMNVTLHAPLPIPTAAWLFGSGLVGLAGAARRGANKSKRKRTQSSTSRQEMAATRQVLLPTLINSTQQREAIIAAYPLLEA